MTVPTSCLLSSRHRRAQHRQARVYRRCVTHSCRGASHDLAPSRSSGCCAQHFSARTVTPANVHAAIMEDDVKPSPFLVPCSSPDRPSWSWLLLRMQMSCEAAALLDGTTPTGAFLFGTVVKKPGAARAGLGVRALKPWDCGREK